MTKIINLLHNNLYKNDTQYILFVHTNLDIHKLCSLINKLNLKKKQR